jgi:hypothetical protein
MIGTQSQTSRWELVLSDTAGNKTGQIDLLRVGAWAWDLKEKGLYSLDPSGRLVYSPLPGGQSQILWRGQEALSLSDLDQIKQIQIALSPDGRWLALQLLGRVPGEDGSDNPRQYHDKLWTYIFSADGRQIYPLPSEESPELTPEFSGEKERLAVSRLVWSADSRRLYYLSGRTTARLNLWRVGDKAPQISPLPSFTENKLPEIAFRPDHDDLLIWSRQRVLLADTLGAIRTFPNPKVAALAENHDLLGLDKAGRAIVLELPIGNHNHIAAVDLNTGKLSQIYP